MLGPEVFPVEGASKGSNISNQAEVIKLGFCGEEETLGLRGNEGLKVEAKKVDQGVRIGVSVREGVLKFGEGSWYMRGCGKTKNGG